MWEHGVVVEAELGKLAGIEDDVNVSSEDSNFTSPDEALEFVERTGCDSLAIAIGTSHGAYKFKGEPRLRFDILEEVQKRLPGFPIIKGLQWKMWKSYCFTRQAESIDEYVCN